jgi:hypothetical protein
LKILEIIRSLDLPNNPLDDIIDQVATTFWLSSLSNTRTHPYLYVYLWCAVCKPRSAYITDKQLPTFNIL